MRRACAAALLPVLLSPLVVGCGSKDGHAVKGDQVANLVVYNYDHHNDLDVHVDHGTLGSIDEGAAGRYIVRPGLRHVWIKSEDGGVLDLGHIAFDFESEVAVTYFDFLAVHPVVQPTAPPPPEEDEDDPWWWPSDDDEE